MKHTIIYTNKMAKTVKRMFGDKGESIVCLFLKRRGFEIIERNYLKKCGEIDIIAKKDNVVHFLEVKTVSCENILNVTYETKTNNGTYRPEDNLHPKKLERMSKTSQIYLLEKNIETEWQFDIACVYIEKNNEKAKIDFIENIIL